MESSVIIDHVLLIYACVAQLVEYLLAKQDVAGSSPVTRTTIFCGVSVGDYMPSFQVGVQGLTP